MPLEQVALNRHAANAEGGGFQKDEFREFGFFVWVGQNRELNAWAAFFHDHGREKSVSRAGFKQAVDEISVNFRRHIVDIRLQQNGGVCPRIRNEFADLHAQEIGHLLDIARARAVSRTFRAKPNIVANARCECREESGTRGRDEFMGYSRAFGGEALCHFDDSGHRDRHRAVRASGLARPKPESGGIDRFDAEQFQAHNRADDIDDGIHRPHLVKVNRVNGRAVNFGFGFGEFLKNEARAFFGRGRNRTAVDDFKDVLQVAVNVAFPRVDIDFCASDAVFFNAPPGNGKFAHSQFVEFGF